MLEKNEIVKLFEDNVTDSDLLCLYRECNGWDGSFTFIDAYTLDELIHDLCYDPVQLIEDVVNYEPETIYELLRYDENGWLESVTEDGLIDEAWDNLEDLIEWLYNDYMHVDLTYYGIDSEWFEDNESED